MAEVASPSAPQVLAKEEETPDSEGSIGPVWNGGPALAETPEMLKGFSVLSIALFFRTLLFFWPVTALAVGLVIWGLAAS